MDLASHRHPLLPPLRRARPQLLVPLERAAGRRVGPDLKGATVVSKALQKICTSNSAEALSRSPRRARLVAAHLLRRQYQLISLVALLDCACQSCLPQPLARASQREAGVALPNPLPFRGELLVALLLLEVDDSSSRVKTLLRRGQVDPLDLALLQAGLGLVDPVPDLQRPGGRVFSRRCPTQLPLPCRKHCLLLL
jgi:hypothetical protein